MYQIYMYLIFWKVRVISKSANIDVEFFRYWSLTLSILSTGTARNQVRPICPHALSRTQQVPRGRSRSHCRSSLFCRSRSQSMSELVVF